VGVRNPDAGLGDFDDTVSVTLTFPGNEIAQFTCSFSALAVDQYRLVGTNGSLDVEPAFDFVRLKNIGFRSAKPSRERVHFRSSINSAARRSTSRSA